MSMMMESSSAQGAAAIEMDGISKGASSDAPVRRLSTTDPISSTPAISSTGSIAERGSPTSDPPKQKRKRTRTIKKQTGKLIIRLRQLVSDADGDPDELPKYHVIKSALVEEFGLEQFEERVRGPPPTLQILRRSLLSMLWFSFLLLLLFLSL